MWTNNFTPVSLRAGMAIVAVIALSIQLKCQGKKQGASPPPRGLMFQSLLPVGVYEGKLVRYDKTLYFYEAGEDLAVQYPVGLQRSKITVDKEGAIINEELQELSTTYKYLLYRRNDSLGWHYDSPGDFYPSRIPVDSLLISHGVFNAQKFLRGVKDSLQQVSARWDSANTLLTERYVAKGIKRGFVDSVVMVYSRQMARYHFSIPGVGVRKEGVKLSMLKFITDPVPDSDDEMERYRREMVFEITESYHYLGDIIKLLKDFRTRQRQQ